MFLKLKTIEKSVDPGLVNEFLLKNYFKQNYALRIDALA